MEWVSTGRGVSWWVQIEDCLTGIPGCHGGESVAANKVTPGRAVPGGCTQNGTGLRTSGGHVGERDLTPASANVQVCEWYETSPGLCLHLRFEGPFLQISISGHTFLLLTHALFVPGPPHQPCHSDPQTCRCSDVMAFQSVDRILLAVEWQGSFLRGGKHKKNVFEYFLGQILG